MGELGDDAEERIIGILRDANVMVRAGAVDNGCNFIGGGAAAGPSYTVYLVLERL